ncbi:unnamed protein product [Rhizophagus irregularis]|nr:unnamed protein product [Rhizophagus irregularis]
MNKVRGNYTSSRLFISKIHNFENLSEPRNATEEEQEAFHSKSYDFSIPDDSSSKRLSKVFRKLQINSNNDEKEITQQQTKKQNININDDDDDIHNNPNLHSNEQDEFEIPDDRF